MNTSPEKILILLENADKIPEIRNSIGVLSRYARFDIYSFGDENKKKLKPELIALYSDDIEDIDKIRLRYEYSNAIWVLVSSNITREARVRFLHQGFISVVTPEASRKTLRKILTSMSRDVSLVNKSKRVLLKTENQLKQLAGDIPDVYLEMGRNGLIVDASPSSYQLLGIQPEKLVGYMLSDIGVSGREQIAILNSMGQGKRYSSEITLKNKSKVEYRCSIIADTNMRSRKVGVAFYCLIRLIEPIANMPAIPAKNSAKQTVVVVKNGVVFELQNGAEKIFDSNETIGVRWHDFLVEIAVDTIASRNSLPDINSDLFAIQDKNGVLRYFKIVSTNQIGLETIECTIEDISEIINHLRLSLKRQMELVELSRRKISDEIRDDMGALISVGKMLIERIVSNDIQQIPDENQPAQSSIFVLLEKAYNRLKAISNEIYPSVIGQFGLEAAMTQFIGKNGEQKPLKIQLQVSPKGFRTDETTEISIYRIFEEAVWFALKVEAAEVSIYLDGHSNLLKFRVIVYMHNKIINIPETIDALMEFKKSVEVKLFVIKGKLLSDIINEKMFTFDFRILV